MVPAASDRISPVPPYSGDLPAARRLTSTGLSPSVGRLSSPLRLRLGWIMGALQPPAAVAAGFGLLPVRSPLLRKLLTCFLFLGVLRCFSSPRWLSVECLDCSRRVSPFGYLRIWALMQLPAAFRSFTRPSSPGYAKASTIRPCVTLCLYDLHGHPAAQDHMHERIVITYSVISMNDLDLTFLYLSAITTSKNSLREDGACSQANLFNKGGPGRHPTFGNI